MKKRRLLVSSDKIYSEGTYYEFAIIGGTSYETKIYANKIIWFNYNNFNDSWLFFWK